MLKALEITMESLDNQKQELFSREAERLWPQLVTFVEKRIRHSSDAEDIVQQTLIELWTSGAYQQISAPGLDAEKFLHRAVTFRLKSYFKAAGRARRVLLTEEQLEDKLINTGHDQGLEELTSPIRALPAPELLTFVTGRAKGRRRLSYFAVFDQPHRVKDLLEACHAAHVDIEETVYDAALPSITIDVLRLRAVESQSWTDVAEEVGYDVSVVRKLLKTTCEQLANKDRLAAYWSGQVQVRRRWKRPVCHPKTLKVDCPFCWRRDAGVQPFTCLHCRTAIGRGAEPLFTAATASPLRFAHRTLIDLRDQFRAPFSLQTSTPP